MQSFKENNGKYFIYPNSKSVLCKTVQGKNNYKRVVVRSTMYIRKIIFILFNTNCIPKSVPEILQF